jgi:hypothetical protein
MSRFSLITIIISFFAIIISCAVDDICTEKVLTPKLILTFYDKNDHNDLLKVPYLYIWAEGKDTLYKNVNLDSISLPLNTNADVTKYILSQNNDIDTLIIDYTRTNVFVSRSCGYKTNFTIQNTSSLTHHWTDGFELIHQQVENENQAHVKIYH